ncbi:PorP/SprF family type IX secretion system membrane protein [Marinoscillum furvescens]|uniref:Type IX secretion system PorP/SprF family membrane protein n=1 Tax=Marinoscillum furvescens DSM 4134 TaxID=1122208 RepID=A0A3D9L2M1_MARFU|nr:PorP/SprF family type IX secretion system membrane protein [Marinoscillum furvescens]RED97029.1 type IX secretion system PorP/SprF family membrane protein [Marinoscillum furvescens DSM 4134]
MKKLLLAISIIWSFAAQGQNTQFSQFFATSAYLNPAFVGLQSSTRMDLNYKSGVNGNGHALQELTHASFIHPIQKVTSFASRSAGVGLTFVQEKSGYEGIYQTTNVLLSSSYVLNLDYQGTKFLSFGVQGGVIQNKLDLSELKYGSQFNPYYGYDDSLPAELIAEGSKFAPTFNVGAVLQTTDHKNPLLSQNSLLLGLSVHSINRPADGFNSNTNRPMQFKGIVSARKKVSQLFFLHPSGYVQYLQGSVQINSGLYLSRYVGRNLTTIIQLGTWYRFNDSFIFLSGVKHKQWKAGISIDLNANTLTNSEIIPEDSRTTYEVSFSYSFQFKNVMVDVSNPLF